MNEFDLDEFQKPSKKINKKHQKVDLEEEDRLRKASKKKHARNYGGIHDIVYDDGDYADDPEPYLDYVSPQDMKRLLK